MRTNPFESISTARHFRGRSRFDAKISRVKTLNRLAVLGAGGHAKVVMEIARLIGWEEISIFDDHVTSPVGCPHLSTIGTTNDLLGCLKNFDAVHIAIGDNEIRAEKLCLLREHGASLASLIHPLACVSHSARVTEGTVIMAGVVINADCRIGSGVILNTGCNVDHDCVVADFAHLAPGVTLAGDVSVGEYALVGVGSSVIQAKSIGEGTVIGAGSCVTEDIPAHCIAFGTPCKKVKAL